MTERIPKVIVGSTLGGGKCFEQMQELVKTINSLDQTHISNKLLVESLDDDLQRLSGGSVSTRIWCVGDTLHCVVVYPNLHTKELLEV